MELEQLRHFLKVAELENFTRAAEQVALSQSALSRSIGRLEEELGRPLFERHSRRITLTDSGRLLFERARRIVLMVDDAKAEICDDDHSGQIRIAAIPTVAPFFLPECLQAFHELCPEAKVIVQEDTTDNLLRMIADGEVDVGVAALPISAKHVEVEPLFDEELLLVTGNNHPLAEKKVVHARDIQAFPFVLLGEAHCLSDNVITFCRRKSFSPVSVERTSQLAMVQELVTLGQGVSLVPAMARARDSSDARTYRSLVGQKPMRTIVMVSNPYRFRSRLVQRFQDHLRNGGKKPGRAG